jgi:beta-aspartyl-dipeptidase (metallo-type)
MILFKECDVYAPEHIGRRDVLVGGGRVVAIGEKIPEPKGAGCEVISAGGLRMIPGLIDAHIHIAGAGGEGGPATRTPELRLSQMLEGGVTTVIGSLGTDGFTRTVESVLMKAKSLRKEGVSAWILTGSYQVPTPTILGDVGRDITLIEEVIGVGEVAISDHRSSCPTVAELVRLAEQARVGGMLGGKAGIVLLHMGDLQEPFRILYECVNASMLPIKQFYPTHCNRNSWIYEDARIYGKTGWLDLTASAWPYFPDDEVKPSKAIAGLLAADVPLPHITLSSDGCGSLPAFDEAGNLVKLEVGEPKSILREILDCVHQERLPLETALAVATSSPAAILKLPRKGRVAAGCDADLVLLDKEDRVYHLTANGSLLVRDAVMLRKGSFE